MSHKSKLFPYASLCIDAELSDYSQAMRYCMLGTPPTSTLLSQLYKLWSPPSNPNPCLACLSVRTALDLYLRVRQFSAGSEIIMSAVNIPSMSQIIHAHGLKVVSLDIDIETMAPRIDLIDQLVTPKSRILLLANVYGRGYSLDEYIKVAARHELEVIEDWAEGFSGFEYVGNPNCHLSLFSFGPIKFYTAFGGCMAKVRDPDLYDRMKALYDTYPHQSGGAYLYKLLKYLPIYFALNVPVVNHAGIVVANSLNVDYKKISVSLLRGFPPDKLLVSLRFFPSDALLATMLHRFRHCNSSHIAEANEKAEYVIERLPLCMRAVGRKALIRNNWLFPVIVDNPEEIMNALCAAGVDAYRGATQLNVVEPDVDSDPSTLQPSSRSILSPSNAQSCNPAVSYPADSAMEKSYVDKNGHVSLIEQNNLIPVNSNGCSILTEGLDDNLSPANSKSVNHDLNYPHNARYLIDHVIYLPINRFVPINALQKMCEAIHHAVNNVNNKSDGTTGLNKVSVKSKL